MCAFSHVRLCNPMSTRLPVSRSNPSLWHLLHWQVDSLSLCHLGAHNGILFSLVKKENSDTCYNRVNLEDIMLSEINHKDCIRKCDTFHDSTYMWYLVRLIQTESRMVVPRGLGGGEVGN